VNLRVNLGGNTASLGVDTTDGEPEEMSLARARALAIVGILVLAALVLVVAAIVKDKQSNASYANGGCAPGAVRITVNPLPPPAKITLNVYNGTGEVNPDVSKRKAHPAINQVANLGGTVAESLRNREFKINKVEEHPEKFDHVARLVYGPKAVAAASVVRAYFLGQTDSGGFDIKRGDNVVDVIIGTAYKELGSKTEVNQKLAQLGNPSPPPGTCDAGR
jgi:hypothetical protein